MYLPETERKGCEVGPSFIVEQERPTQCAQTKSLSLQHSRQGKLECDGVKEQDHGSHAIFMTVEKIRYRAVLRPQA